MSESTHHRIDSFSSLWAGLSVSEKTLFWLFILLKSALLFAIPLTGDEAYFIVWGQELSFGYYDHPPAVGWVNYLLSLVADNLYWYRGFAFFASALIAYLIYQLLTLKSEHDSRLSFYVAMAFFVSPVSLMFVINANDTVLVFFGIIGVFWFAKAMRQQSWMFAALAGVFLGMAFLSKYFAVFMLTGLLIFSVLNFKAYGWKLPLLAAAIVLLFVGENLYFNLTHCWNNILFNFFSRTRDSEVDLMNVLMYLGMLVLMLSPLGVYYWLRYAKRDGGFSEKLALYAGLPLLLVLVLVSFSNVIGLHWPLLSIPLMYLLYVTLPQARLKGVYLFNVGSSLLIAIVLLGALPFINQLLPDSQKSQAAIYTQSDKVCALLPNDRLFTLDYSSQSALAYHCENDNVHVFMSTSKYGREDDKNVDFQDLDGQNLIIFISKQKDLKKVAHFFKDVKVEELKPLTGVVYYLVTGQGFDYAGYREQILKPVYEQYYLAPDWLPKGECRFKQIYDF